jgi:NADPH:quinone reductase-like Zn-dependent oxidoreductase
VTCSCECSGVLTRVGSRVPDLRVGDRVVCLAPGYFGSLERVPYWATCRLEASETFVVLKYKADLQPGESVLIHSAAGGMGIAAIQYAKYVGAEV